MLFYLSRLTVTNVNVIAAELQTINFEVENDLEEIVKIIYEKVIEFELCLSSSKF